MEYKSIINNILLNTSLQSKRIKILIKYLKSINDCLILTLLDEILPKWCKEEFLLRNEKSIEKCVCLIIDKCLEYMTKNDLEMSNNSNRLLYLMDGIQHLLNSNNEYCKRYGEYLSNKLFKIVDKEHKPIECDGFSDNDNEEEEETENNNKYHYTNPEIKEENEIKSEKIENVNENKKIYENPLLIIDSIEYNTYIEYELLIKEDEDDNDNESDSDSDSLESYDLIEKENKMIGKEKYLNNIRDIIDGLKDDDNLDKRDISLLSLDKLLKSHPIGIEKYGLKLCIILLNLRNGYFFENFEEIRNRNVIRIINLIPLETVPYLIKEFYSLEKDLEYRIMILKMLSESAKLLCDVKSEEEESKNENKKEDIKRIGKIIKEFKKVTKPKIIKNRFLEYSDIYLIPLMNGIDHKNRQIDLLNKDGYLLSKLLYCIGIIYECCYNSIKIIEYNITLLKIIFICRFHQDNNVRISILYLLSRLVLVTPKSILESYFMNELSELSCWLLEVSKNDIDPICREYSSIILNSGYFLINNSINI